MFRQTFNYFTHGNEINQTWVLKIQTNLIYKNISKMTAKHQVFSFLDPLHNQSSPKVHDFHTDLLLSYKWKS